MAKFTATLTAQNTNTYICTVNKTRQAFSWLGTFLVYGTFGGGTVTFYLSPDSGTTLIPMKDWTDTTMTATSATNFNSQLGVGGTNSDHLQIYAGIGAATNPSITLEIYDNTN